MTLFMPPIQRKKKVEEKYNPDTFRVMSEDAVSDHPKFKPLPYRASFEPRTPTPKRPECLDQLPIDSKRPLRTTRVMPQTLLDFRAHKPQPKACGFLDRNVRFLNEPICNVYTKPVQHEEEKWWPSRANPGSLIVPPYAEHTHYRIDYNYRHGERPTGSGRHTAHLNREAALGAIPVNCLRERDGSQRFYKEGLSYEHMYNSRVENNYPIRGKRHGAFVWSRMDPMSQKKFIEYHQRLDEEERLAQMAGREGPSTIQHKTGSAPVIRSTNHKSPSLDGSPCQPLSPLSRKSSTEKVVNSPKGAGPLPSVKAAEEVSMITAAHANMEGAAESTLLPSCDTISKSKETQDVTSAVEQPTVVSHEQSLVDKPVESSLAS